MQWNPGAEKVGRHCLHWWPRSRGGRNLQFESIQLREELGLVEAEAVQQLRDIGDWGEVLTWARLLLVLQALWEVKKSVLGSARQLWVEGE